MINSAGSQSLIERAVSDVEFRHGLSREAAICTAAAEPASSVEIGVMLHRLSLHYPDRKLTQAEAALVAKDWLKLLEGIPHDLVDLGFSRWLGGAKSAFFPKPGEILASIDYEFRLRKKLAQRATEINEGLSA